MLFLGITWTYQDALYVIGKTFLRRLQRRWNRRKRFSIDGDTPGTSLTNTTHREKWGLELWIHLLVARAAMCGYVRRC